MMTLMTGVLFRFRDGSLTVSDIDRLFKFVIIPFLAPSIFGMFAIDDEAGIWEGRATHFFLAIIFITFFILNLLLFFRLIPKRPSLPIKVVRVLVAVAVAAILSVVSGGYVSLWNALSGSNEKILVSGPVIHLKAGSGRWVGKVHNATIRYDGRDIELIVASQEFSKVREGDTYERWMKLGGLGYYYTWGLPWWK